MTVQDQIMQREKNRRGPRDSRLWAKVDEGGDAHLFFPQIQYPSLSVGEPLTGSSTSNGDRQVGTFVESSESYRLKSSARLNPRPSSTLPPRNRIPQRAVITPPHPNRLATQDGRQISDHPGRTTPFLGRGKRSQAESFALYREECDVGEPSAASGTAAIAQHGRQHSARKGFQPMYGNGQRKR